MDFDTLYMRMAVREAQAAASEEEVPIGAIIVHPEHGIVGKAHNQVETLKDATAHAEVLAITQACEALDNWRLENCTLYVTKEPCPMCAGAIVFSRISKAIWGVSDPVRGGESQFHILHNPFLVHRVEYQSGILEEECRDHLVGFFRSRRLEKTQSDTPNAES
jgi:tRNA(adenine34) deaminase